jgi:uncharacterized integral membrane protein
MLQQPVNNLKENKHGHTDHGRAGNNGCRTMNKLKLVAVAVVGLVVVIVVLQNTQAVETHLLFLTLTMPNAALLFGTLIMGFALGVLMAGHIVSIAKRTMSVPINKQPKANV